MSCRHKEWEATASHRAERCLKGAGAFKPRTCAPRAPSRSDVCHDATRRLGWRHPANRQPSLRDGPFWNWVRGLKAPATFSHRSAMGEAGASPTTSLQARVAPAAIALLGLGVLSLGVVGCRPDMYNQPRYKTYAEDNFFHDGASARPLPPHTVARGHAELDPEYFQGKTPDGKLVETLPEPVTAELLQRGRERYDIYCSVCHDRTGDGHGMIVQRGFPAPPSYHTDRLRTAPLGHFYDVITNGYGVMYSYAARVEPADRWAITAYIRTLQLARNARLDDVPGDARATLPTP